MSNSGALAPVRRRRHRGVGGWRCYRFHVDCLAVVIDLFSRQVVGWSLREDMTQGIVIDALRMAWFKRHQIGRASCRERVSVLV